MQFKSFTANKTPILNFADLDTDQQDAAKMLYDNYENEQYVTGKHDKTPIGLSNFIKLNDNKRFHAYYLTSFWSCYYLRLNRSNDGALLVEVFT